ncbi:hypothetical protein MNEG_14663 [Monoraphidium neglectum]|uniref:Uncharacterized protein n=1 Tax=Monoraphidium neglectum TaxID=145388 RepID=A0A0D2LNC5_9CHLO|nr:hypothetical protein MNEG_14663 [Monoraphidium neglectum]KIY93299.1 hypothetical protein MNEG_14663 [Monoraphidium neglectum]|eukprot:XP_013892319.1 hypothetical protein MNEG_14663 [Monoraphidium neglectum]
MLRGSPAQPRKWRKRLLLYAAVLALLSLYWPQAQIALRLNRNTAETQRSATAARSSNRSGGYEMIGGAEVVWQRPTKELEGVLFVAHGCNHAATDWLPKSDACPRCTGLPEETNITRTALRRGIAVVAVKAALGKLLEREGLDGLPLYALGASSGGAFALALASEVELDGVCSQVMAHPAMEHLARAAIDAFGRYPPTAFVLMPRDERTAGAVQANAAALKSKVRWLKAQPGRVCSAQAHPRPRRAARLFWPCP